MSRMTVTGIPIARMSGGKQKMHTRRQLRERRRRMSRVAQKRSARPGDPIVDQQILWLT